MYDTGNRQKCDETMRGIRNEQMNEAFPNARGCLISSHELRNRGMAQDSKAWCGDQESAPSFCKNPNCYGGNQQYRVRHHGGYSSNKATNIGGVEAESRRGIRGLPITRRGAVL